MVRLRWPGNLATLAGDCRRGEVHELTDLDREFAAVCGATLPDVAGNSNGGGQVALGVDLRDVIGAVA